MNKASEDQEPIERLSVTAPRSLAQRIRHYWHTRQLPSQSEAVRHLIERGLEAEEQKR